MRSVIVALIAIVVVAVAIAFSWRGEGLSAQRGGKQFEGGGVADPSAEAARSLELTQDLPEITVGSTSESLSSPPEGGLSVDRSEQERAVVDSNGDVPQSQGKPPASDLRGELAEVTAEYNKLKDECFERKVALGDFRSAEAPLEGRRVPGLILRRVVSVDGSRGIVEIFKGEFPRLDELHESYGRLSAMVMNSR